MDKIILQGLVDKWHGALRYLKGHQDELSTEEWSAIEVLQDLWRTMSYGPDMVREANEMIEVLIGCDKYHSNNREIISKSKEFRGVAKKFYTESATTFNEIRTALQPPRRPQSPRPAAPAPAPASAADPEAMALTPGVLLTYVRDSHKGFQYMLDHREDLDSDEAMAVDLLLDTLESPSPASRKSIVDQAVKTLVDNTRLHSSNRDIITHSKYITSALRKYNASERLIKGYATAFREYLRKNPLKRPVFTGGCPIRVTDIKIGEADAAGNWIPSQFYTDLTYLYVRVYYERLDPACGSVDFALKFINPSGQLDVNSSVPGFTLRDQNTRISQSGYLEISGWGNKNGHGFGVGTWTVEAYINGHAEGSARFTMRDRSWSPAIRITGATFMVSSGDKSCGISPTSFYSDTCHIAPVITFERLRSSGPLTVYYKLYDPSGRQIMPANPLNGYTWKGEVTPQASPTRQALGGFGNPDGTCYSTPGQYRVDFYLDGQKIYSSGFNVVKRPSVAPSSRPSTTARPPAPPRKAKKSKGWMWILGIIAIVGGYFGFNAYMESEADKAATVMYAISDSNFFKGSGSDQYDDEFRLKEGDKVLVYNTEVPGWSYVKSPKGKKGYVATSNLVTGGDNELLQLVTGTEGNPNLDAPHKRAALLHLLRSEKIDEEYVRGWRIDNCGVGLTPNTVSYTRHNDGTDPDLKTLSMVLHNEQTGERKIAIYAFPTASTPELRYFADAPAGKEISDVTYKASKGYYYVNYASGDKRVSRQSKPDSDNPFIITDLKFVDKNNSGGLVSNYVGKRAQYVAPKITYRTTGSGTVKLYVKVIDNYTGEMLTEDKSPTGYSYVSDLYVGSKGRGTESLIGWGNSDKKSWNGADRRFEIYYRGNLIASGRVNP